jgi:uncharacterized phage protein gp47/JayE
MAFERPTLAEIVDRVQSDFVSRLSLTSAVLRRSVVYVLSRVIAGAAHMLHGHLDFLSRQLFPDTSEGEYLERHASLYGIDRTAATFATGTVVIYGTNATVIPDATILTRSDSAEYETDAEYTIATLTPWAISTAYTVGALRSNNSNIYLCITAGTSAGSGGPTTTSTDITDGTAHWRYVAAGSAAVTASVTAVLAGADGSLDVYDTLTFSSPIAGATAATLVASAVTDGSDEESDEDLRVRLLERMADPINGGTAADYVTWTKEVAGVTRAWATPQGLGPGTVLVYFVRDDDADPIPSVGEVATVQAYLDEQAPAHATPTAAAPTAVELDLEIEPTPDTSAIRAAIEAEIEDLILRESEPGGTILISAIRTAIGSAAGVTDYILTETTDFTHDDHEIAVMGTITWV